MGVLFCRIILFALVVWGGWAFLAFGFGLVDV